MLHGKALKEAAHAASYARDRLRAGDRDGRAAGAGAGAAAGAGGGGGGGSSRAAPGIA